jgi:predicted negative regulator of RcsB-dependent stress response
MNRGNLVYLAIGALIVIASLLGYQLYQDRKQPEGVQILVGPNGVSIEKN